MKVIVYSIFMLFLIIYSDNSFSQSDELLGLNLFEKKENEIKFNSNLFKNKLLIGIGEETHNSHQEQIFENTLIKKLILESDFNIIMIEAPSIGAKKLNDYVNGIDDDDIKMELFKLRNFYWIWKTNEFVGLLNWIKKYNKTVTRKIQIIGIDKMSEPINSQNLENYNNKRDSLMAVYIKTILDNQVNSKAILLAHDVHISNSKLKIYKNNSMGFYLKSYYGNDYFSIGQIFGKGSFNTQITSNFNNVEMSYVNYDISKLSGELNEDEKNQIILTKDNKLLKRERKIWFYGGNLDRIGRKSSFKANLSKMFDAVIFHDSINAASNLLINGNYFVKTVHITKIGELVNENQINFNIDYASSCKVFLEIQLYNNNIYVQSIMDTLYSDSQQSGRTIDVRGKFNMVRTNLYLFEDGKIEIKENSINKQSNEIIVNNIFKEESNNHAAYNKNSNIKFNSKYGKGQFELYRFSSK